MERIYTLKWDKPKLNLYFLGDWHWGSEQCQRENIKKIIKIVKDDPLARWVGMGDMMENALTGTLGDVYEQTESPNRQLLSITSMLRPIADKCAGLISGNHGNRTAKIASIDPDMVIAHNIGCSGNWFGISWFALVKVMERTYKIFAHHTTGGGRTKGGKLGALSRMVDIAPLCDIYVGGHDHSEMFAADRVFDINTSGSPGVIQIIRRFFRSGSLLDYDGSYAERKLMPPAVPGQLCITLHGSIRKGRSRKDVKAQTQPRKITWEYLLDGNG